MKLIKSAIVGILLVQLLQIFTLAYDSQITLPTAGWLTSDYSTNYLSLARYACSLDDAEKALNTAKKDRSVRTYSNGSWVWVADSKKVEAAQKKYDSALESYSRMYNLYAPIDDSILSVAKEEYKMKEKYQEYLDANPDERTTRVYNSSTGQWEWTNPKADSALLSYQNARENFVLSLESIGYHANLDYQIMPAQIVGSDLQKYDTIPQDTFSLSVTCIQYDSDIDSLVSFVAAYDNEGKLLKVYTNCHNPSIWSRFEFTNDIDNNSGNIHEIKIMMVNSENYVPVCDSLVVTK